MNRDSPISFPVSKARQKHKAARYNWVLHWVTNKSYEATSATILVILTMETHKKFPSFNDDSKYPSYSFMRRKADLHLQSRVFLSNLVVLITFHSVMHWTWWEPMEKMFTTQHWGGKKKLKKKGVGLQCHKWMCPTVKPPSSRLYLLNHPSTSIWQCCRGGTKGYHQSHGVTPTRWQYIWNGKEFLQILIWFFLPHTIVYI